MTVLPMRVRRGLFGVLVLLSVVLRVAIAWVSHGTNDAGTWTSFARTVATLGLLDSYRALTELNHPPLMPLLARASLYLAELSSLRFVFVFKLWPILADVAATAGVYVGLRTRVGEERALVWAAVFAWNPVSILISAYHCNTDSIAAAFVLWAALVVERGRAGTAGFLVSAALNVKLIALPLWVSLVPVLRSRPVLLRFLGGTAVGLLPLGVLFLLQPDVSYRNIVAYNSNADNWGVTGWLNLTLDHPVLGDAARSAKDLWRAAGRYIVLLVALGAGLWARWRGHLSAVECACLAMASFLVCTPGFGVQYLAYPMAPLFIVRPMRGAVCALSGGVFLAVVYLAFWRSGWYPYQSHFFSAIPVSAALWGFLLWGLLIEAWVSVARVAPSR